jgi:excisionase family DNA binding protein
MPEADELLTVAEVAAMLKLNPQTIRNWIDRGELPCVRIGPRRVRIKRSDFDQLIQAGYTGRPPSVARRALGLAYGRGSFRLLRRPRVSQPRFRQA